MSDVKDNATKTKVSAKESSKMAQIFSAVWIAGWSAYAFISGKSIDMGDILMSGVGITAMFVPIYSSIILDKIREIKVGKGV